MPNRDAIKTAPRVLDVWAGNGQRLRRAWADVVIWQIRATLGLVPGDQVRYVEDPA